MEPREHNYDTTTDCVVFRSNGPYRQVTPRSIDAMVENPERILYVVLYRNIAALLSYDKGSLSVEALKYRVSGRL